MECVTWLSPHCRALLTQLDGKGNAPTPDLTALVEAPFIAPPLRIPPPTVAPEQRQRELNRSVRSNSR
jgi:hypothetical protein